MICPVAETLPSYGAARSPGQTTYAYDALGRQTLRVVSTPNDPELGSISDTWTYDEANGGQTRYGLLTSEQRTQGMLQFNGNDLVPFETDTWHKLYAYDEALRPAGYTTTIHPHSYGNQGNAPLINASTYTVSMAYDSYFGRVKSVTYPQSGVGEYTRYTIDGFVVEQGHSNDYANPAFWHRIEAMTASGQVKRELYGNGVVQEYTHDARTQQMTATQILASDAALSQLHSYQHDLFGNLIQQTRTATTYSTEDFQYDHQHRLRNSTRSGAANGGSIDYSYDELGNLLSKSDYGSNYQYGASVSISGCYTTPVSLPGPHAVSRVMAANNGGSYEYGYDANGNLICSSNSHNGPMQIHYDPTNKPFRVQRGSHQTEFWYGSDDQRYFQRDNSAGDTIYIGKLFEQKSNGQKKYYLGNYAVFTADISAGDSISYLHTDRLGSIIAISDENGNNTSNTGRGFDPFGKPREEDWDDVSPFAEGDLNGYETTTRGFTGHEHLNGTDLIHMNGRAYDYNLGRFLSVDPVINHPTNSQSLNPYSYIMNNPMAGVDPTGYRDIGASAAAAGFGILRGAGIVNDVDFDLVLEGEIRTGNGSAVGSAELSALLTIAATAVSAVALEQAARKFIQRRLTRGRGRRSQNQNNNGEEGVANSKPNSNESSDSINSSDQRPSDSQLEARAQEIHGQLDPVAQRRRTTAITEAVDSDGNVTNIVSSSEPSLSGKQKEILGEGEVAARGPRGEHAEVTGLRTASEAGIEPTRVAASRPICENCESAINDAGAQPASPLKRQQGRKQSTNDKSSDGIEIVRCSGGLKDTCD